MAPRIPVIGAGLAAVGLAHFAKPEAFEAITRSAFPDNVRTHTLVNGGIETALGAGLVAPQTRRYALAGVVAYLGYLIFSAVRARR